MRKLLLVAAVVAAVAWAVPALGAGKPAVRFVKPVTGWSGGSTVAVRVALTNFTLDPKHVGLESVPNHGHLHFQMDGGKYDFARYSGANGKLAAKLGIAGTYSPAVTPTITYRHLPKGRHTLAVLLANNDHSPVGAQAKVTFTVR